MLSAFASIYPLFLVRVNNQAADVPYTTSIERGQ